MDKVMFQFVVKSSRLYTSGLIVGVAQGQSNHNQKFSTMKLQFCLTLNLFC